MSNSARVIRRQSIYCKSKPVCPRCRAMAERKNIACKSAVHWADGTWRCKVCGWAQKDDADAK